MLAPKEVNHAKSKDYSDHYGRVGFVITSKLYDGKDSRGTSPITSVRTFLLPVSAGCQCASDYNFEAIYVMNPLAVKVLAC
jgi:hypothetical protein